MNDQRIALSYMIECPIQFMFPKADFEMGNDDLTALRLIGNLPDVECRLG